MKKILLFLFLIIGLNSCTNEGATNKSVKEPVKETVKESATTKKNMELVNQYFDLFNQHQWDKMAEMYIEVADFKDASVGDGIVKQTRLATSAHYKEMHMKFADLKREVLKKYPSSEHTVVVEYISTGTATDRTKIKLPGNTSFTFQNGKITKDFSEGGK